jgi:hypothetical protein
MSTMTLDQMLDAPRPATARPAGAPRRSTVRLTRRGRVVVFVAGLIALLGVGLLVSNGAGAASHAGTPEQTHTVVVEPGVTLWSLASQAADGGDVRAMVAHIEELNGLSGASLAAGQTLRVPGN